MSNNRLLPLDDNASYFYCHDLGLVGGLLCSGCKLAGMDKSSKKVLFVLERNNGIEDKVASYWNSQLVVDAQTYFNQIKRLKNQMFSSL